MEKLRSGGILALLLLQALALSNGRIEDNVIEKNVFPVVSTSYVTQGTLYIPYAEIEEPFTAWFDPTNNRSRIDYYGGETKTYQLGNLNSFGVMRKIVPITTDSVTNEISCFEVNGTGDSVVHPQPVIPQFDSFSFVGNEVVNSVRCKKFQLVEQDGHKINKYTYWLKTEPSQMDPFIESATPIKYEMRGFNSLLGSHYDHYFLIYDVFSAEVPSEEIFDLPAQSKKCRSFPGPGNRKHRTLATFNPMKEFMENHEKHIHEDFEDFSTTHKRIYKNSKVETHRLNIFRQNHRFIHSKNRAGLKYKLAVNHLADKTEEEIQVLRGKLSSKGYNGGRSFETYNQTQIDELPTSLDWRLYGAVTPVKDQSVCGSCWSFGTTGTIEGTFFLKTGQLKRLSQQALIDCSWGYGNNGCDGGEDFRSYKWIMKHGGIPSEADYGAYLGVDGFCHAMNVTPTATITGFVNVPSGDAGALKLALNKYGPISVGIDASHKTLSFYSNGVYYEKKCKNSVDELDHAVLAVGYGTMHGENYWLIKNSWSTYWGNDGYVLMSMKDNNCGVTTAATYVTM